MVQPRFDLAGGGSTQAVCQWYPRDQWKPCSSFQTSRLVHNLWYWSTKQLGKTNLQIPIKNQQLGTLGERTVTRRLEIRLVSWFSCLLTSHYLLIILKMIPLEIFQNLTGQICFVWLVGIYLHRVCTIEFGFLSLWSHESYWSWNVTWFKCNYDSFNKECFCVGKMDKNHDYCRVTFMINLVPKKLYCRLILNSLPSVNMFSMLCPLPFLIWFWLKSKKFLSCF